MLTFSAVLDKLADQGLYTVGRGLSLPRQPIRDLLLHPPSLHQMREDSICVLYVSEFASLPVKPAGLYLLISDRLQDKAFRPEVANWAVFPPTVSDHLLCSCLRGQISVAHRVDMATLRLSQSLLRKNSLGEIAAIGEQVLGNPVFISDTSTKVLLFSNMEAMLEVKDELIQSVVTHGFVTSEYFDKYDYPALLASIEKSDRAFISRTKFKNKQDRIIARLTVSGRYFGWVVAFPCFRPFEEGDCEIMDMLSDALTLELEKRTGDLALSRRESLLMELMSHQIGSGEEFWARANCLGWHKSSSYHVVAIGFRRQPGNHEIPQTILAYKNHLALILPNLQSISIRNRLVLLLETDQMEPIFQALECFLASYQLCAAVSNCFSDIMAFPEYYEQAADILQLGPRVAPGEATYFYRDLYLHHYISALSWSGAAQNCYLPFFLTLLEYDRQYHTNYLETLRAYLKHRNALSAAEALHIHRNTMNYRLQKIQEITGQDPTEGDNIYKLWFSFILYDLTAGETPATAEGQKK